MLLEVLSSYAVETIRKKCLDMLMLLEEWEDFRLGRVCEVIVGMRIEYDEDRDTASAVHITARSRYRK